MKLLAAVILTVIALSAPAHAQTPTPTPSPTPTPHPVEHTDAGQPRTWTFSDGREMTLYARRLGVAEFTFGFGVSESTCDAPVNPQTSCKIIVPLHETKFQVRWTKHPDATKIGQPVSYYGNVIDNNLDVSSYEQLKHPEVQPGLTPTKFQCSDFTWLSGTKEASSAVNVFSINSENMIENPETGMQENRTTLSIFSPVLEKISADTLSLANSGEWVAANDFERGFGLVSASVIHFVVQAQQNASACQISLKPDFSQLGMQLMKYETAGAAAHQYEPFINGSQDLYTSKYSFSGYVSSEESSFK